MEAIDFYDNIIDLWMEGSEEYFLTLTKALEKEEIKDFMVYLLFLMHANKNEKIYGLAVRVTRDYL